MREVTLNSTASALADDADDTQTVIEVADASDFPASGNYRLFVGGEVMHCMGRTGNDLTVVRGIDGTAAASHLSGTPVKLIITAQSFNRLFADNVSLWGRQPPMGIYADDGSVLTASSFSWLNQGSTTAVDQGRSILMTVPPASGENVRGLIRSAPSTPYSYVVALRHIALRSGGIPNFGLALRQSSSGRFTAIMGLSDSQSEQRLMCGRWTSPTSSPSSVVTRSNYGNIGSEVWLRAEDDGTDINLYFGDGLAWSLIYSEGRTSHMTSTGPDQIMVYGNNWNSSGNWDYLLRICHFGRDT